MNPLADSLVNLICDRRVLQIDLEQANAERESYRLLSQQAVHQIRALTLELDRLREAHQRLVDEYRQLRATMIGSEAA